MSDGQKVVTLEQAADRVRSGARVGLGGGNGLWRRPLALVRELIRQQRRDLDVVSMLGGLDVDLLIGAGCVASTSCAHVGLDELGQSPHLQRAARDGSVEIREHSEFTLVAALRAAGMGLSFMPWKTAWGTDVVERLGWRTVRCPYEDVELLAVPAATLDVAVLHAVRCDAAGNVERSSPPDFIEDCDRLLAHAARTVIVCCETVGPIEDPARVGLIGREVDCVVEVPGGAWPGGMAGCYEVDGAHLTGEYMPASADADAFAGYLDRFVRAGERA